MGSFAAKMASHPSASKAASTPLPKAPGKFEPHIDKSVHRKDDLLVNRASQLTSTMDINPADHHSIIQRKPEQLPKSRIVSQYEDPVISGSLAAIKWAELIVSHRKDPHLNTIDVLATTYNIDPVALKTVLTHLSVPVVVDGPTVHEKIGKWEVPKPGANKSYLFYNEFISEKSKPQHS
uniref:Uncharacterized protein n=1 Tax=Spongospora subterranea TaxID=70186 RepID=A0A0H5R8X3_9EUKA|eukprot:CRZ10236.1 hypothetical protein [Spongospora subterranea]